MREGRIDGQDDDLDQVHAVKYKVMYSQVYHQMLAVDDPRTTDPRQIHEAVDHLEPTVEDLCPRTKLESWKSEILNQVTNPS